MDFDWVVPTILLFGFFALCLGPVLVLMTPSFTRFQGLKQFMDELDGEPGIRLFDASDGPIYYPLMLVELADQQWIQVFPDLPHQEEFSGSLLLELREPRSNVRLELFPTRESIEVRFKNLCEVQATLPVLAEHYTIFAETAEKWAVLEHYVQELVSVVRVFGGETGVSISFSGERFQLRLLREVTESAELQCLVECTRSLFGAVSTRFPLEPSDERTGPLCRTCGVAISTPFIACGLCHAPHHEDCWAFSRACTLYPCTCAIAISCTDGVHRWRARAGDQEPVARHGQTWPTPD